MNFVFMECLFGGRLRMCREKGLDLDLSVRRWGFK